MGADTTCQKREEWTSCGVVNAYGLAPHKLVEFALEFFHVPACVITIIAKYCNNLCMCFSLDGRMAGWQELEVGIAISCSISPILFVASFEIILIGARQMAKGLRSLSGGRLPVLSGYMDDVKTILQTALCAARLLKHLDKLMQWAMMEIKPSKSRSLSIRKGARDDRTMFTAGGEKIPLLKEKSIQSIGRKYISELSNRQMGKLVQKQLREGLEKESTAANFLGNWRYVAIN